jgi:hypothetical protein
VRWGTSRLSETCYRSGLRSASFWLEASLSALGETPVPPDPLPRSGLRSAQFEPSTLGLRVRPGELQRTAANGKPLLRGVSRLIAAYGDEPVRASPGEARVGTAAVVVGERAAHTLLGRHCDEFDATSVVAVNDSAAAAS